MGATYVDVKVSNPAAPEQAWEGEFLVDTGASHSVVPRKHLEAIGVKPVRQREYEMADGSVKPFDVAPAVLEFMGVPTTGSVIFGDSEAEPLLGFIALEDAEMEVDPLRECLKPRTDSWLIAGLDHFIERKPKASSEETDRG
ncbi:MAG: clan AA aspartic protease [Acidimicrobiaceae bacterium]|nr:clan AA aspartic protease [Acidimicrobiaceae bacterium]MCY4279428.1 clan AA aspartic protease [Acidimicrobiaceae bacterium]MCY4293673.1 clan AA aspartic protease [Acidimicrobiaceae bacterium]